MKRLWASAGLFCAALALAPSACFGSATATLAPGANLNFNTAASGDPSPDATNDVQGYLAGVTAIHLLSPSGWSQSSFSGFANAYANSTLADAQAASYNTDYVAGHGFIPTDYTSSFTVYYMRTGAGASVKYFKLRTNGTNTAANVPLLWDYLGGAPTPPSSQFTHSSYDLITDFTDTSTGGAPNTWSWTFGDGGTSAQQSPRYRYTTGGSRSACLTASNTSGGGGNTCNNVTVAMVVSTQVAVSGNFNLDGDGLNDMQVLGPGCPPITNQLHMLNGAKYTLLYKDYRNITVADIGGGPISSGDFCVNVDYLEAFLVKASSGAIYKAWTAGNNASGVRLEFALLQAAPPPVPVSNFTFSSYDLITQFTDTSTNTPNGWAWAFGDGGTSTNQSPAYRYATAGTRSSCLTASNSGGAGNQVCKSVNVSQRPSTTVLQNTGIDLEADSKNDLLISPSGGCPVPNKLTPINGALYTFMNKDYRTITVADANAATFTHSAGGFCVAVDYLQSFLVLSSFGAVYRAWTAANDAGSVRIEYSLLIAKERLFANGFE